MTLNIDVAATPREELPGLLGRVVELEARIRMRLVEPTAAPQTETRFLDAVEGAAVAGTSKRWLLTTTKGMKFRHDLSRKQPRFDEAGLRAWMARRRS